MARKSTATVTPPAETSGAPETNGKPKKTECPISREEFEKAAKALNLTVNGVPLLAEVKQFSTGSFGRYLNGKIGIDVGGKVVSTQLGFNLTCVGSKDLPK